MKVRTIRETDRLFAAIRALRGAWILAATSATATTQSMPIAAPRLASSERKQSNNQRPPPGNRKEKRHGEKERIRCNKDYKKI